MARREKTASPRGKAATAFVVTAVALAVVLCCTAYFRFVDGKIQEESADHLDEVYTQVNARFSNLVSVNWNHLTGWAYHIASVGPSADAQVREFVEMEQEKWGFTDFYFLNSAGSYRTASGASGYIDLGDQLVPLMTNGERIVVDGTLPTGAGLTVFAVPALSEGSYEGFEYRALAVSYNNADMEAALDVDAFGGQSDCFVVYGDGRVLFSANIKDDQPHNYLTYIGRSSDLSDDEFAQLHSDLAAGQPGFAQYRIDGTEYYLVYKPVGFQDWMLLGVVPTKTVNSAMDQIQWVTMAVLLVIFAMVGAASVTYLLRRSKRKIEGKDRELAAREQLLGVLTDKTDDIFVVFTGERGSKPEVDYVSPNIERVIGISAEEIRESLLFVSRTAVDADNNLLGEDIYDIPLGRSAHVSCERVHQATGERRWYSETLYHLSLEDGEKFILMLSDRTQEKQAADTLSEALAIAKSSNEAKSTFLANMSHDIRTPINAIMGMTRIARENMSDLHGDPRLEKAADSLDVISHSSQHLLNLINDVLDMSRIESGQLSLQEKACTLDSIIEEIEAIVGPQAAAKSQTLTFDTSGAPHRTCVCDRLHLNQVLLNLLSNAVKYTPEGGTVSVTVEEIENMKDRFIRSRFVVADTGMGMPPELIERIFEPFERGNGDTVAQIQGTGLGMPITKAIVDAMGGAISIESEPGKGSTFTVTLKLLVADEEEAVNPSAVGDEPEGHYDFEGKVFLLAEDNDINALIMQELLAMEGASAEWAENGQEAVRLFEEHPAGYYDAILMDVQMPVMGGYAATAAIRSLPREDAASVPIVALTANAFAEDVAQALEAGMNAHVAKPVDMGDLGRALLVL